MPWRDLGGVKVEINYTRTSRLVPLLNSKKIYQANLHQKQPNVRPKARWKDDAENDRRDMAIVNWRQVVQDRDG
jgi:hypothetical protein